MEPVPGDTVWAKLRRPKAQVRVAQNVVMDWSMLWKDLVFGFLVAGGLSAFVPDRVREGEEVVVNVANRLREDTSIHWHGLILPSGQDGVPGVSDGFQGIPAGTTHQYRFPLIQAGTYWYHSHSATQEQSGLYGPIVIEPRQPDPFAYDRDYIVQLSNWTDETPDRVIAILKRDPSYYNYSRRTAASLVRDMATAKDGAERMALVKDRLMWGDMRMDPTDIEDVTGYTFLVNGRSPDRNYTALFRPGERVRLHFINETMMNHPMHLHGMWMVPDVGNGTQNPLKHVVNIKPGAELNVDVAADAEGGWGRQEACRGRGAGPVWPGSRGGQAAKVRQGLRAAAQTLASGTKHRRADHLASSPDRLRDAGPRLGSDHAVRLHRTASRLSDYAMTLS